MKRSLTVLGALLIASLCFAATASADVRPGVQTLTEGAQCTGNFIFSDGTSTYLGQAAHCSSTSESTTTDGCEAGVRPIGTRVEIEDAANPGDFTYGGTIVYSSWNTMHARGETIGSDVCRFNDFSLIKLDAGTPTSSTVPFWGGPNGVGAPASGSNVFSYGNSSLRFGIEVLKPKRGRHITTLGNGWSYTVYTATPGIPGDSGSGFLTSTGQAMGVLSTVAAAPFPASNNVTDLGKAMAYMKANAPEFAGVNLVNGTTAFNGGRLL